MSNNLNIRDLELRKNDILKAEIGVLLFNLGKTHIGFWKEKNGVVYFNIDENNFKTQFGYSLFDGYKKYYEKHDDINKFPFEYELEKTNSNLQNFIFNNTVECPDNNDINWEEFFYGDSSSKDFIKNIFFRGCENINSGIDKGSPQDSNQLKSLWISNAFGSLKKEITDEDDFDASRLCFWRELHRFLEDNKYYNSPDWVEIRKFVFDKIESWYSRLLSDSRFPVNDITLWDQAYMTASMFKATLAGLYLDNSKNDAGKRLENFLQNPQEIKWSILGIQYDKLGLAEKGLKAASINWYRNASKNVDDAVKKLIEIKYPLGNEVYRDETGIYFVVAENIKGEKEGDFYKLHDCLSSIKSEIQDIFTDAFDGEVYPAIFLTEPSRGLMNLGYLIEEAGENFLKAELPENFEEKLKSQFDNEPNGVCQVCKLRLAYKGDKENLICNVCEERQKRRIYQWLDNSDKETIWLDELQDKNGRVALITLKFELEEWINGDLVNSLLNQNIGFPINCNCPDINALISNIANAMKNNKKINNTCLKDYHTNVPNLVLREIVGKWFLERSIGSRWEKFIKDNLSDKRAIDFDNRKIDWNKLNNDDIEFLSQLLLQFLLRKNPSPARLGRIWETTKEFFEGLESKIIELAEIPEERQERLMWNNVNIKNGEYQDGDILFWVNDGTVYLISSIDKIRDKTGFKKHEFNLKRNNNKNDVVARLNISDCRNQPYKPYFTILSPTPISWQFIIPAEYVPNLIRNVQEEYYKNFKWVYGKLPLHIGIVVQNYKRPLYVGIKALRKIRRDKQRWEDLRIPLLSEDFKARQKKAFHYQKNPEQVADCENYYSLFERVDNTQKKYNFYLYPDKNSLWIDTTQNATDTDKFYFYPNTFDFEFLDTNARRNDIYYEKMEKGPVKRAMEYKQMRPYDIEDWECFEKFREYFKDKKTSSKLHKLVSLVYSKLEDWGDGKEAIKTFMISAFTNILMLNKENRDNFVGIWGLKSWDELEDIEESNFIEKLYMFLDMFEFWHTTLKEV